VNSGKIFNGQNLYATENLMNQILTVENFSQRATSSNWQNFQNVLQFSAAYDKT